MNDTEYAIGFSFGQLHAYIDMIKKGVKTIGTPDILLECDSPVWSIIDYEIEKSGLRVLVLDWREAEQYYPMVRRMVFPPHLRFEANRATELLFKSRKSIDDHKELGELFGYGDRNIEEFLSRY